MQSTVSTADLFVALFVGLKLGHVVDWPWWQVLIPYALAAVIWVISVLLAAVFGDR